MAVSKEHTETELLSRHPKPAPPTASMSLLMATPPPQLLRPKLQSPLTPPFLFHPSLDPFSNPICSTFRIYPDPICFLHGPSYPPGPLSSLSPPPDCSCGSSNTPQSPPSRLHTSRSLGLEPSSPTYLRGHVLPPVHIFALSEPTLTSTFKITVDSPPSPSLMVPIPLTL